MINERDSCWRMDVQPKLKQDLSGVASQIVPRGDT